MRSVQDRRRTAAKKETVSLGHAVTGAEVVLPVRVQEPLGELVGAAKDRVLALRVRVGPGRGADERAEALARAHARRGAGGADAN